ncbi:cell division protein ZapA [Lacicoccus alkaliphilus]|uniref:Cell division protein ZapA n=1 Tax=Lacicoccus alkaliphilus DSM 16010 TaxID=1123231 RepID=A0A1M7AU52_9BACL|nr:cell division protein ZapA [Salinicoccus alkaliphilus]SHL46308.1 cell division protein ZapA [Salinicoccus alkaliphilus DSM 16010]
MAEYRNRIYVDIYDQQYTIIGTDEPEHIRHIAHLVDQKMREIGSKSAGLDTTRKAVLTAVNVMDDYVKLQQKYDELVKEQPEEQTDQGRDV